MKMIKEHYTWMATALDKYKNKLEGGSYAVYADRYRDSGLSYKRFIWDVLYAARLQPGCAHNGGMWPVYDYLNNTHIETALCKYFRKEGILRW